MLRIEQVARGAAENQILADLLRGRPGSFACFIPGCIRRSLGDLPLVIGIGAHIGDWNLLRICRCDIGILIRQGLTEEGQ